jgi:membrane protein implicated in regulation of membrane protease activity
MLSLYLISFLIGGVLVGLSAFSGGDHDHDADFDFEADADVDVDADVDADADADGDADGDADHDHDAAAPSHGFGGFGIAELLPIASLRFWTFFLAFGGLLGTLLTLIGHIGPIPVAITSLLVGYLAGFGITAVVRRLKKDKVSSIVVSTDCIGSSGRVLLPISGRGAGQVRIELKGRIVDFVAETEDETELGIDEEVLVYDVRDDGVALVSRQSEL